MGIFQKLIDRFTPTKIINANRLDEYVLRMIGNNAVYPDYNADTFTKGYTQNGDVFTVINKITEPASIVPIFQVDKNENDIPNGRMLSLLNTPNPWQSQSEYIEALLSFYLLFGNAYSAYQTTERGLNAGMPLRLDILPPQWMKMIIGTFLDPIAGWQFVLSNNVIDYKPEEVFHWKEFNPDYDITGTGHLKGMSRLQPILKSIIGSGSAYDAMVSSFQHQGAFGILTMMGENGATSEHIGKSQLSAIKRQYQQEYTGSKNAGKIVVTKWDHKWTNFGVSPKDMEVLKSLGKMKGAICDAYNVPSQLLSGSQDRTYNNYHEASKSLWSNAIQPSLDGLLEKLSRWLAPKCKEDGHRLVADYSNIEVLQRNTVEIVSWMVMSKSFTKNEIREAAGYERLKDPAMDKVYENAGVIPLEELGLMPGDELTEGVLKALKVRDYRMVES